MATANPVAQHYGSAGIAERVLAALRAANGPNAPITVDALASIDHFHGRGVLATEELASLLNSQPGERIIDIGSGIGGPARWIAAKRGVHVTGVDLTPEFCEAAEALNAACGMTDRVRIIQGSALALPVADGEFDRAYSHNVVMNIEDKAGFYREAFRVLKPGGVLALANVCAGPNGEPYYPQPWATTPATSSWRPLRRPGAICSRPGLRSSRSGIRAPKPCRRRSATASGSNPVVCRRLASRSCWGSAFGKCASTAHAAIRRDGSRRSRR